MADSNPLRPLSHDLFTCDQARHLLLRAGFAGDPSQIEALAALGLDAAVNHLVHYQKIDDTELPLARIDPDIIAPLGREGRMRVAQARRDENEEALAQVRKLRNERQAQDRRQFASLTQWWLGRMIQTPRPLEEKLTLLWHGHFAANFRKVRDSNLMYQQNEFFRTHACGSFADLARGIIRDPAMIAFLDNQANRKGKPNENLARELMELFTLGEGQYTEDDIKQGARALTGYGFTDNDFTFRSRLHDRGSKTILGHTDELTGEDFVTILLKQPACARFVATKLYKHFVADIQAEPNGTDKSAIERLSRVLRQNDYQIAPALTVLFKSQHFYSDTVVGQKIKSPAELLVGTIRSLKTPVRDVSLLADAMSMMGQALFNPPSVAGWDGGRAWINTSTLFVRQNVCNFLITGKLPFDDGWTTDELTYHPDTLLDESSQSDSHAALTKMIDAALAIAPSQQRRAQYEAFLRERPRKLSRDTLIGLLLLITASPEYQMC